MSLFEELPEVSSLKNRFVADMHYHTHHSYDCRTPVKKIVKQAEALGIAVAITDHNSIAGVLEAYELGATVIPGIEICTKEGKEAIAYFYSVRDLENFYNTHLLGFINKKNPLRSSKTGISMHYLLELLQKERCIIHLPHPFAPGPRGSYAFFMKYPELLSMVDSIEVFNEMMSRKTNLAALGWASQLRKGVAGGSDGHILPRLGKGLTVSRASSYQEHLDAIKDRRVEVFGTELKALQRVLTFARGTGRTKLQDGVLHGFRSGISFPKRAFERL